MESDEKIIRRFAPSSSKKRFMPLFQSRDALILTTKEVWLRKWISIFDIHIPLSEIGHVVVIDHSVGNARLYITERTDEVRHKVHPPRLTCDWLDNAREAKLLIDAACMKYADTGAVRP